MLTFCTTVECLFTCILFIHLRLLQYLNEYQYWQPKSNEL